MKNLLFGLGLLMTTSAFSSVNCQNLANVIPELEIEPFKIQNNVFNGSVLSIPMNATGHAQRYETELATFLKVTSIESPQSNIRKINFQLSHIDQLVDLLDRCIARELRTMSCQAEAWTKNSSFWTILSLDQHARTTAFDDGKDKVKEYQKLRAKLSRTLSPTNAWTKDIPWSPGQESINFLAAKGFGCQRVNRTGVASNPAVNDDDRATTKEVPAAGRMNRTMSRRVAPQ